MIWNGNPLSQFTKAEQTWVEGRRYFSLDEDKVLREEITRQRAQIIQAVLAAAPAENAPGLAPRASPWHGGLAPMIRSFLLRRLTLRIMRAPPRPLPRCAPCAALCSRWLRR
ncbi:MAG: hypothetical protein IPN47_22435 [Gemmatimonadetes bacterium]|nr:hypothetical protein [Gemmatimonadota bacterium]